MVRVTVHYVDQPPVVDADPAEWAQLRGEGVDKVVITTAAGSTTVNGCSAYWLYREGERVVVGGASFGYEPILRPEVVCLPDGQQQTRPIEFVPDLPLRAFKIGWWWR